MKHLLTLLLLLGLAACGSSDKNSSDTQATSPPPNNNTINISALPGYLVDNQTIAIYDLSAGKRLVSQLSLTPNEQGTATVSTELAHGGVYKIVFNPNNDIINIRCPLRQGCLEYSYQSKRTETIAFNAPLASKLQLSAIIAPTTSGDLTINLSSDLAARLMQSDYIADITPQTIAKAQSAIANTLGLIGYGSAFNSSAENSWNSLLNQAINAGILFDQRQIKLNATSRLTSVLLRIYQTLNNDNKLDQLNDFYLSDADIYLQDIALTAPSSQDQQQLARVRAYILAKNIYPQQGFAPSPYIELPAIDKSKKFLDDFRSILYTFIDDSAGYQQVNDSVTDGYRLIDDFSQQILVELFPLFDDVLREVPIGSADGQYILDGLLITYNDDDLAWHLVGEYEQLTLDVTVTVQKFKISSSIGNSFTIIAVGDIDTAQQQITLTDTRFELKFNPPDNPFSGEADGSGHIAAYSNITLSQDQLSFNGQLNARLQLVKQADASIINTLESAAIYGTLTDLAQQQHQLSLAIVHPDISTETNKKLISDRAIVSFSYSAPLQGLSEPLLTLFVDPTAISEGLSVTDLDTIAYFAGRLTKFTFKGKARTFNYQGANQDNVTWQLDFDKKISTGQVDLAQQTQGKTRVLKEVAGILFSDGNFISIF